MQINTIQDIIILILLTGIVIYLFWLYMQKDALESQTLQIILQTISDATQEAKKSIQSDFESFRAHFAISYEELLNKIKNQQQQIDKLTELLNRQTEDIKKHYAIQNKEIERLRKELHKTQNMLSRCKKRLQRIKDVDETTR